MSHTREQDAEHHNQDDHPKNASENKDDQPGQASQGGQTNHSAETRGRDVANTQRR